MEFSTLLIFNAEILIYQSKVSLDKNSLFGNIPHLNDPVLRKMLISSCLGTKILPSILVHDLPSTEIRILYLKLVFRILYLKLVF